MAEEKEAKDFIELGEAAAAECYAALLEDMPEIGLGDLCSFVTGMVAGAVSKGFQTLALRDSSPMRHPTPHFVVSSAASVALARLALAHNRAAAAMEETARKGAN